MEFKNGKRNLCFGFFDDCPVVDKSTICVKRLDASLDVYALRYVAEKLCKDNDIEIDEVDSMNAVQDNHLYLGNFEGIQINGFLVRTLFLTDDNRVCAECEDLDEDFEPTDNWFVLLVV